MDCDLGGFSQSFGVTTMGSAPSEFRMIVDSGFTQEDVQAADTMDDEVTGCRPPIKHNMADPHWYSELFKRIYLT